MCHVTDWRGQALFRFFFTPTLVLVLGCLALFCFPLFLLRTAVGCVLCVLYVTDTVLLGHLSCWDSQLPPPTPLSFLQIWLDKGRRYKRRASIVLERSEPRVEVGKRHRGISSYLIKTQNVSVSVFRALGLASFLSLKNHLPKTPHLA